VNGLGIKPFGMMLNPCASNVHGVCMRYTDEKPSTLRTFNILVIMNDLH
jgi:hypothetical protein